MKKKCVGLCVTAVFLIMVLVYSGIQKKYTVILPNDTGRIKTEKIQPLLGIVKVSGDSDTDVIFTDVETGEQYIIGYITHGVTEKIKLERGKWYKVEGVGNLTLYPVNVRGE